MRTWGPAVLILVVLGGLLVWAQCGEEPVASYEKASFADLRPIAEGILGELPPAAPWTAEKTVVQVDRSSNVADLVANVDSPTFDSLLRRDSLRELRAALETPPQPSPDPTMVVHKTLLILAYSRAALAEGDRGTAAAQLSFAAAFTRDAVETSNTVEQWEQSQIARLRFLEVAPVLMRAWPVAELAAMPDLTKAPDHRSALGRVVVMRFVNSDVRAIAEASATDRPSRVVAKALYGEEEGDEERLAAALLHRHPRAFSPEQTVIAGAESVRSLREALGSNWATTRDVLDLVARSQAFWSDFDGLLEMEEAQAIERVKQLGAAARSLENPVGLALLHEERTSWSGLAQSAYVADAKEAVFLYMLTGSANDPIGGGSLKVEYGEARFQSSDNDGYSFIKALTESRVRLQFQR
jgi:hypothetical protein